jgi:RNAse (barnase) inhibitor barstar
VNLIRRMQVLKPKGAVLRLENQLARAAWDRQGAAEGLACFFIQGSEIQSKDAFLKAVGSSLDFPGYYGENWDALEDCLTDLSWIPAKGYCLLFDHAGEFARAAPGEFSTALAVLRAAGDFWATQKSPMWILLRDRGTLPKLEGIR